MPSTMYGATAMAGSSGDKMTGNLISEATMPDPIETLRATLEQTLGIRVHYWDAEAVMARMGKAPAE